MSLSHIPQLIELLGFLNDFRPDVRRIAMANLLPYTTKDQPERTIFLRDQHLEQIAKLCSDIDLVAHDAISTLINLTDQISVIARLKSLGGFIESLVAKICDENALLSDLCCMLLSNLTKDEALCLELLSLNIPISKESGSLPAMDLLLEIFLKGEGKKLNPNANYDFLASVFANVSTNPKGRAYLLATPDQSQEPPLVKLISFTEHPSMIRRGGVASSIKNCVFVKQAHHRLIAPTNDAPPAEGCIDLLPQILLPLCGPEEFDIEESDTLPEVLQLLPKEKEREKDANIRAIHVETLVLLATTRACRESMRSRGVYQVIKLAHLAEIVKKVTEPMVRLVDLLMREEGPDTAIENLDEEIDDAELMKPDNMTLEKGADVVQIKADAKTTESQTPSVAPTQNPVVDSEDEEEMMLEV